MKKTLLALILSVIFILSLALCISAADSAEATDEYIILGDVDGDGQVTNADVLMIYRYIYDPDLYPLPTICRHVLGNGDNSVTTVVEATCSDEGYTLHKCKTCNYEYRDSFTAKKAHNYGDWEEKFSTCTARFLLCSCTKCGVSTYKIEYGSWHKYTTTVVAPTCSEQGYTLHSCENCGDSYKDTFVDATGEHTWQELYVITSTCAEKKIVVTCKNCNEVQVMEVIPTEDHDYVDTVVPPTYDEQGYTEHTCKVCGDSYKDNFVPVISSVGLRFTSNGDGTCYVRGIGTCIDTDIVIPKKSPEGDSVTSIGQTAFLGCTSITSIKIPDSVTSIGDSAFIGCASLASVTFAENSKLTSIGSNAFNECASLKSIEIPVGVTSIGDYAFEDCTALKSVEISDSVTSIGSGVFTRCPSLSNVTFAENSKLTSIGSNAFYGCTSLASITIPDSVTSIDGSAFHICTSLASVTFAENSKLTSIGSNAFYGCTSLTSITIPDSVTSIGSWAFGDCTALASVTFAENSKLTSIGACAFYGCTSLASITIPDSVTSIDGSAFHSCTSLASVTFAKNSKLTSIGSMAFYNCNNLKNVYYAGTEEQWKKIQIGGYNYSLTSATIHYNYTAE